MFFANYFYAACYFCKQPLKDHRGQCCEKYQLYIVALNSGVGKRRFLQLLFQLVVCPNPVAGWHSPPEVDCVSGSDHHTLSLELGYPLQLKYRKRIISMCCNKCRQVHNQGVVTHFRRYFIDLRGIFSSAFDPARGQCTHIYSIGAMCLPNTHTHTHTGFHVGWGTTFWASLAGTTLSKGSTGMKKIWYTHKCCVSLYTTSNCWNDEVVIWPCLMGTFKKTVSMADEDFIYIYFA